MTEKYFCRNCKGLRRHKSLHQTDKRGSKDEGYFQWINSYYVIECEGCETVSFLKVHSNTEMVTYKSDGNVDYYSKSVIFPYYLEKNSEIANKHYLPEKIKEIYIETINALKAKSLILTAGGLRATIEALCNNLKIKKGNLEERIDALHNKGHLTISESKRLHSIRFLGNDALHEIETPKIEHLYILLDIINHLLTNLFINDKIIKGKIETVIDNFEEFIKLIQNKLTAEMLTQEFTLQEIIGKSKRLIPKAKYIQFEDTFISEIKEGKHTFAEYIEENKKFKILEMSIGFDRGIF